LIYTDALTGSADRRWTQLVDAKQLARKIGICFAQAQPIDFRETQLFTLQPSVNASYSTPTRRMDNRRTPSHVVGEVGYTG